MQREELLDRELSRHWRHGTNRTVGLRDRFEMLFEHNLDAVFFMTLDEPFVWKDAPDQAALLDYAYEHLRVTEANHLMCAMMRTTREQLLGTTAAKRWGDSAHVWKAKMRELYDNGRMFQVMRAPVDDGTWIDIEGQYVVTTDEQGRITGHFGTQRDVTEKRKLAARLELAIEGGDVGIWDYDVATREVYYDPRWVERMGYSPSAPQVRDAMWWASLVHASDQEEARRTFLDHVAGRVPFYRCEFRMRKASGEWVWVMSSGRVTTHDTQGRPTRILGVTVDITERKVLQERLFLAERMASLGTLAAGVGHEINTPLTYIVLNLTLMERELRQLRLADPTHARLTHMLEQARYGTERVSNIVRDLQALTRVPDERIGRIDPIAVLERCLEIADHQIRHRAHAVRSFDAVPYVRGSEGRVVQLFLNLIVNAAQAIPDGHADSNTIEVRTSTRDGNAVIEIRDTGVGIAPEVMRRIFDPFYTTKQVGEGTGLGLAICRSIVSGMCGEIQVDSVVGQGTTFRVVLPPASADAPHAAQVITPVTVGKKRVLVIDDEPMVGQLVAKVLDAHDVVAETSGRSALARLRAGDRYDVILCDVMMPEVSGMDFYAELGDIDPGLRGNIVFLSGGVFTDRAQTFLDSVPNRRLAKPFDVDALTAVLLSPGDHDALP
jgi:PAS domain S-box-containing protein